MLPCTYMRKSNYLTKEEFDSFRETEFKVSSKEMHDRFKGIDVRFDSIHDELCTFIRETAEEQRALLWKDFDQKHYREIGAISESYNAKIKAIGEGTMFISEKFDRFYLQLKANHAAVQKRMTRTKAVIY
jgi:hypothetical protein